MIETVLTVKKTANSLFEVKSLIWPYYHDKEFNPIFFLVLLNLFLTPTRLLSLVNVELQQNLKMTYAFSS
jgi:hypothetical protein